MKTKITILTILASLCVLPTFGQYRLSNSTAMTVTGGYVNSGWNVNVGAEFIAKNPQHSIRLDAYYFDMKMATNLTESSLKIPVNTFTLAAGYAFSLCKYITNAPINISLGGGLHAGYESFSKNHGSVVTIPDPKFMYGLWASIQFEIYIAKKISIVLEPRIMYALSKGNVQPFMFMGNGGIKIHL